MREKIPMDLYTYKNIFALMMSPNSGARALEMKVNLQCIMQIKIPFSRATKEDNAIGININRIRMPACLPGHPSHPKTPFDPATQYAAAI